MLRINANCKMQNANPARLRRAGLCLHLAFCILHCPLSAAAQEDFVGRTIVDVVIEEEGQRVSDPLIYGLVQTRVGQPLSMRDVRDTFNHLDNLRRFDDIQPTAEAAPGGVRVRYVLVPAHPIDRILFRGDVGVPEDDLRRVVTDRLGRTPSMSRADEAAALLVAAYRTRGYPAATVKPALEVSHTPHRTTLTLAINAGRRARIADVQFRNIDPDEADTAFQLPDVQKGVFYEPDKVRSALEQWEERMRSQGYYQARASVAPLMPDDAYLTVSVARGPRVMLEFAGDPLPEKERERLVPIRAEGSADEDLLEDAKLAIEQYLHRLGYRDAIANYTRNDQTPGELRITFQVMRGPRYTVEELRFTGNTALATPELEKIVAIRRGDLFDSDVVSTRAAAIEAAYRGRGYTRAKVDAEEAVLASASPDEEARRLEVTITVDEGPRTVVRNVLFTGNATMTEAQLREIVPLAVGAPFVASTVVDGRDLIEIRYRNRGYVEATVTQSVALVDDSAQADVTYSISEGPQAIVEHIIITGNDRTKAETILNELEIREGEPLGLAAMNNSRLRLARLGLFRRIEMESIPHPGEVTRDVLIQLEEADRTTLGYGGGLEGTFRPRPTGPGGAAEDQLEIAPRGFFEIGRRNLWGSNQSINLFTRVSLRSTDILVDDSGVSIGDQPTESNLGFNEYRVVASFREPRLTSRSELIVTGIIEQAVRTSFNFARRIARAEVGTQVSRTVSVTGRYSFERTKLFDEAVLSEEEQLLIDKLFPQVRISKVAGSVIRDTRDDLLDPNDGAMVIVDGDLALRALGSEVGFVRTFAQGFFFKRLPSARRIVAAFGARVGLAHGFEREKEDQIISELPASERFFAGGDTTVRGFALDRLGDEGTITATGFPLGGNGVVVLNAELRATIAGSLQGVGFVDAGNVFALASELSFIDLRPAAGFGVRYNSPFGPIRFDLGFNLDPKTFSGAQERRTIFHISLGQAF